MGGWGKYGNDKIIVDNTHCHHEQNIVTIFKKKNKELLSAIPFMKRQEGRTIWLV